MRESEAVVRGTGGAPHEQSAAGKRVWRSGGVAEHAAGEGLWWGVQRGVGVGGRGYAVEGRGMYIGRGNNSRRGTPATGGRARWFDTGCGRPAAAGE